ncbi:uncharacterized protein LOC117910069 [Vitis riparia]|uniref:uncharacterized protein LOC117910069 n=1 Tax=Vitis riparia TaxID=96939 RepID=UPI00155AA3B3|nr:uncharacterized protein LOC117910069 [Vitis riparia]
MNALASVIPVADGPIIFSAKFSPNSTVSSPNSEVVLDVPVKPRKGHLLVLENFNFLQLKRGLMEVGYTDHEVTAQHTTSSASGDQGQALSISMTATMDTTGNLVLGSSRQFSGFDTSVNEYILDHIWERARVFFLSLKELPLNDITRSREVRVGLRPYMPDGKPLIGPVPGFSNLFLATGHEGVEDYGVLQNAGEE